MFTFQEQVAAAAMLEELRHRRLEVVRVGRCRVVNNTNPEWYQAFCGEYMKTRKKYPKNRTFIKRCWVIKALQSISNDDDKTTIYVERLLPYVKDYS